MLKIKYDIHQQLNTILSNLNNFHSLGVVGRVSETQLQVGEKFGLNNLAVKGLSPHDALKHHFTSLKTDLIFLQMRDFRRKISMKLFYLYMAIFKNCSATSNHLHPPQVENCDSNLRLVVEENNNGKFRLERVKSLY